MTNRDILRVAMAQSALDLGCRPEDFEKDAPVLVRSVQAPGARKYLQLPFFCNLVTYGNNVVASVSEEAEPLVRDYLSRCSTVYGAFETPCLHRLDEAAAPLGQQTCFMAEYFLPDVRVLRPLPGPEGLTLRWLGPEDFAPLYTPRWSNALSAKRPHLDRLALGAYDGEELVGLAGASADCDTMWQIGIDVLPGYRRRGIACVLTSGLAAEILSRGKVPFYCAAWSNIPSVRNAVASGFRPAWVELTLKPLEMAAALLKSEE